MSKSPDYILKSVEVKKAGHTYLHRIQNLVERHDGYTPTPKELKAMAVEMLEESK